MQATTKFIVFLCLCSCFFLKGFSQEKKLTVEDAVLKERTVLGPAILPQIQWRGTTGKVSYVQKQANGNDWWVETSPQMTKGGSGTDSLFSLNSFNEVAIATKLPKFMAFPIFNWLDNNTLYFNQGAKYYSYSVTSRSIIQISEVPAESENIQIEPKNFHIAYSQENNLHIRYRNGQDVAVTHETDKAIVCGFPAHRNEFGINQGIFWNHSGTACAFYRMDQTMVTDYPIIDFDEMPAKSNPIKYPFAGQASHHATVGVFDLNTQKTIYLNTGEPKEQYLTNITFTPDDKLIYIAIVNRGQNELKLNVYNAETGAFIKTLFTETHAIYVEPEAGPEFLPSKPSEFLWLSERDGFNHIYHYDTTGKLIAQITRGNWIVSKIIGFNKAGSQVLFLGNPENPTNMLPCTAKLAVKQGDKSAVIWSQLKGVHTAVHNANNDWFVDIYSSAEVPREIAIRDFSFQEIKPLLKAENPLKSYTLGKTTVGIIPSGFGQTHNMPLYYRMITPPNYDPNKKYPALIYVYGGSHAQLVINNWLSGASLWFHYLAQEGYVVFTVDNRGSENRGRDFQQATFRKLGQSELEDQLTGLRFLKSHSFVDSARIAVYGWSFGGFMTTTMMCKTPFFKVGIAGGPVIDWKMYEIMYTERYMDTPAENPAGYKEANLLSAAHNLNGRLMLIHGTSDDVVVWQHSIKFLKEAIKSGKQVDYFVYPGHQHNVLGPDRLHLIQKITRYLFDFL